MTDVAVTLLNVPHAVPVHPAPVTVHVTPLFCASFCTVAVRLAVVDTCTEVLAGLTVIPIGGVEVMVITVAAVFEGSATEAAVRVTDVGAGKLAGARKSTDVGDKVVSVPQAALEQPAPESDQITPRLVASF